MRAAPAHAGRAEDLRRELRWLPELAPRLPLRIPEPVAAGRPTAAHALAWAVYLHQAALIIPCYGGPDPAFAGLGRRTVEQVLTDATPPAGSRLPT